MVTKNSETMLIILCSHVNSCVCLDKNVKIQYKIQVKYIYSILLALSTGSQSCLMCIFRLYLLIKQTCGVQVREFSSRLSPAMRQKILEKFAKGQINV